MPMFAECTKWQSWVCQFMVPSHALKHEGKTTCGWQGRKHLAGSYMGPSPLEQILPLQMCTWFLSSPSMGLNLTEFPMVHFRRRNMFPTATNSLWQTIVRVSLGFPQTISWFVCSQKLSCASTVCPSWICRCHHEELCLHTLFNMFFPNRKYKVLFSLIRNTLREKHRSQLLFLEVSFIH